jgi:hypothetical protein
MVRATSGGDQPPTSLFSFVWSWLSRIGSSMPGMAPLGVAVNATKEKKLTNMRSSTSDELVRLIPRRPLSLDQVLKLIGEDESVEVTPLYVCLRKVEFSAQSRQTVASRGRRGLARV